MSTGKAPRRVLLSPSRPLPAYPIGHPTKPSLSPIPPLPSLATSKHAQGAQPRVRFDPPMLEMGPVLPNAPQGDLREVRVLNEGEWDVEIFSLDFDKVRLRAIGSRGRPVGAGSSSARWLCRGASGGR